LIRTNLKQTTPLIGGIYALCGAILFSSKAVLVKLAYQYDVDTVSLLMLRMLFSLPFFLVIGWISIRQAPDKAQTLVQHKWKVIILGLLGYYIASYLDLEGLHYIDASLERIILFIYPTLVVILSFMIYKIRIKRIQIAAILITYVGIIVAFRGNISGVDLTHTYRGAGLVLLSASSYSIYLVGTGDLSGRIGTKVYNSAAMAIAAIAIITHNHVIHGFNLLSFEREVYGYALLISILATVIPSYLIVEGIRIIGANNSSIIGSIGPVSTIIMAVILLGEQISLMQGIGSIIVILGVLLILYSKSKNERTPPLDS